MLAETSALPSDNQLTFDAHDAQVDAALVRKVDSALHCGVLVRLRDAAEHVLTEEADVAGQRVLGLDFRGCGGLRERRTGNDRSDREREQS
jgi:hypothetical protein